MIELIKWCFRSEESSIYTIIALFVIFGGIAKIIEAFKN
jgi:hypothetical protein